jgi:hypothetical protein
MKIRTFLPLALVLVSSVAWAFDGDPDASWMRKLASRPDVLAPAFQHSLGDDPLLGWDQTLPLSRSSSDRAGLLNAGALEWENGRVSLLPGTDQKLPESRRPLSVKGLAMEWQPSAMTNNLFTFTARSNDWRNGDTDALVRAGTAAALSWSTLFGGASLVTGRLFAGDEETQDRSNGYNARRYYGLLLEGRYSLWREHAPFASLSWQRNDYDLVDSVLSASVPATHRENSSRIAAGWNWQIQQNWGLRAEANYRLTDGLLDSTESDRTQFYFSTRYGFR